MEDKDISPEFDNDIVSKLEEKRSKKLEVRILNLRPYVINGIEHLLVVTTSGKLRGFLVPLSDLVFNTELSQKIEAENFIEVYAWQEEINAMLPSIEEIKRNILLSIWRSGAITMSPESAVKRKMLESAYPYTISFKEK